MHRRLIPCLLALWVAVPALGSPLDCVSLLEKEARLKDLQSLLSDLDAHLAKGALARFLGTSDRVRMMMEIQSKLLDFGVETMREEGVLRFVPGGGHSIGRIAQWLEERGLPFRWDPRIVEADAQFRSTRTGRGAWQYEAHGVEVSTEALVELLHQPWGTTSTIRHELTHVQNSIERLRGRDGYFYGKIVGANIPGYERGFHLDELPAYFEGLRANVDSIHRLLLAQELSDADSRLFLVAQRQMASNYRRLSHYVTYLTDFYRRLLERVRTAPFERLGLVRGPEGVYFQDASLGDETFSLLLSPDPELTVTRAYLTEQVLARFKFHGELVVQLASLDHPVALRLRRMGSTSTASPPSPSELSDLYLELREKLPEIEKAFRRGWIR